MLRTGCLREQGSIALPRIKRSRADVGHSQHDQACLPGKLCSMQVYEQVPSKVVAMPSSLIYADELSKQDSDTLKDHVPAALFTSQ